MDLVATSDIEKNIDGTEIMRERFTNDSDRFG